MTEDEYLKTLAEEAQRTAALLSDQEELERRTCAALLRCLGVEFRPNEIVAPKENAGPPDIIFRDAKCEIRSLLDPGRRLQGEWQDEAERRKKAAYVSALLREYKWSTPLSLAELAELIAAALADKAKRYDPATRASLDALVYVNIRQKHLAADSGVDVPLRLRSQGWRSVSFVYPPHSGVLLATEAAPRFLRDCEGTLKAEWQELDTLFE